MKKFKVLYVGGVHHEGSSFSRYIALRRIFNEVLLLDTSPTHNLIGRIKTKILRPLGINHDKKLFQMISLKEPNIVWFDKPTTISNLAMRQIYEKYPDKLLVAHITDDIKVMVNYAPKIIETLSYFDVVFTPNKFNITEFTNIKFVYNELGYDDQMYRPLAKLNIIKRNFLSFIGHYELSYEDELLRLSELIKNSEFRLKIFGSGWWRSKKLVKNKQIDIQSGWKSLEELKNIYTESIAGIGLYSHINRNFTSGRIFEIPALMVPLITKDNGIINYYLGGNYINLNDCPTSADFLCRLRNQEYLAIITNNAAECMRRTKCTWNDRIVECVSHIEEIMLNKLSKVK